VLVGAEIRALSVEAEGKAYAYAQAATKQWFERVWARTDSEFIPWVTDYWTHQWLALKLMWYRARNSDSDAGATEQLADYLQEQFRSQVLEPVAQEIAPPRIMDETSVVYVDALGAGIRALRLRHALPRDQLAGWLSGIPAIADPPGATLRDLVDGEAVTRIRAYQTLTAAIRSADEGAGTAADHAAVRSVADRTAERLSTTLVVRGGATAASVLGGVAGILLGLGASAWDVSTYDREKPLLQANVRSDLDGLLRRVQRNLLEDPTYGVLAPVTHIAGQLAAALPAPAPLPQIEPGPLQDPF